MSTVLMAEERRAKRQTERDKRRAFFENFELDVVDPVAVVEEALQKHELARAEQSTRSPAAFGKSLFRMSPSYK